ncbi:MAG: WD40 repeat domain-containing protein [Planctomycetaceae bacterium]|nr:WD40 repeat domain-containing protein [Planctomycetaceae bacterium]
MQRISRYGLREAIHAASEKHPRESRKNHLQNHGRSFETVCPHCRFIFEHHIPRYSEVVNCPACGIRFELKSDLQIDTVQIEHIEQELAQIRQELQQHSFPKSSKHQEQSCINVLPCYTVGEHFSASEILTDEIAADDEIVTYESVLSDDTNGYWLADYVHSADCDHGGVPPKKIPSEEKTPLEFSQNPTPLRNNKTKTNKSDLSIRFAKHWQNHKNQWRKKLIIGGILTGLICVFVLLLLHSRDFSKQVAVTHKKNSYVSDKQESNAISQNLPIPLPQSEHSVSNDNVLSRIISFSDETPTIPLHFWGDTVPGNYAQNIKLDNEDELLYKPENVPVAAISESVAENPVAQETHPLVALPEPVSEQLIPLPSPEQSAKEDAAERLVKQNEAESLLNEAYMLVKTNPIRSMLLALQSIRRFQELGLDVPNNARWTLNQSLASQHLGISLNGFYGGIEAMTLSKDGRWFLFADDEGKVWLWDVTKHEQPTGFLLDTIEGGVLQLHITSNLNWGICVASNGMIRIWNLALEQPSENPVDIVDLRCRFAYSVVSEDGHWLAAYGKPIRGSQNSTNEIYLWNLNILTTNQTLSPPAVLKGHEKPIRSLVISKNSQWLASGSEDKTVRVYDLQASAAEQFVLKGHELEVNAIAMSPDGRWLATGGRDAILRIWDLQKRPNMQPISLREHDGWISTLVFSNDGRYLATGSYDKTIRLWRIENVNENGKNEHLKVEHVLTGHESPVKSLQFSENNNRIVSLGLDKEVRLWNLEQGNPSENPLVFYSPGIPFSGVLMTNDSRWLMLAQPKANLKKQSGLRLWPLQFSETLDCASKFANASFSPTLHNAIPVFAEPIMSGHISDERIARTNYNQVTPLPEVAEQPLQENVIALPTSPMIITSVNPSTALLPTSTTPLAAQPSASPYIQLTIPRQMSFQGNGTASGNSFSFR